MENENIVKKSKERTWEEFKAELAKNDKQFLASDWVGKIIIASDWQGNVIGQIKVSDIRASDIANGIPSKRGDKCCLECRKRRQFGLMCAPCWANESARKDLEDQTMPGKDLIRANRRSRAYNRMTKGDLK